MLCNKIPPILRLKTTFRFCGAEAWDITWLDLVPSVLTNLQLKVVAWAVISSEAQTSLPSSLVIVSFLKLQDYGVQLLEITYYFLPHGLLHNMIVCSLKVKTSDCCFLSFNSRVSFTGSPIVLQPQPEIISLLINSESTDERS